MTIAERGRDEEELSSAVVFSWSELPDLLAAEDLFEVVSATGSVRADLAVEPFITGEDDYDLDDDEDDDDDYDDDEDDLDDDEEDDDEEDDEDDDWEDDDDDEEDDEDEDEDEV